MLVALAAVALPGARPASADEAYSIATIVSYGVDSSLALDGAGNPIVAYHDLQNDRVKVLRCDDPVCAPGGDTTGAPDLGAGRRPAMTLDASGNPVIAYWVPFQDRIRVMRCNDPACTGGGDTVSAPDPQTVYADWPASIAIDGAGYPAIAYPPRYEVRIMRCNDPSCAGLDESITAHDAATSATAPSLALDASGNPVVSYYTGGMLSTGTLKVMHCNDANCAGNNESLQSPDSGTFSSLRLDAAGRPVIAYYTGTSTGDLKVMHCNDANCAGGNESIVAVDTAGNVGRDAELVLDAAGNPVVSYNDVTNDKLKLLRCNDPNCAGGDESIATLDTTSTAGANSSLALDASGNPIITYDDHPDLQLVRCITPTCTVAGVGGLAELPPAVDSSRAPVAPALAALAVLSMALSAWRAGMRLGTRGK